GSGVMVVVAKNIIHAALFLIASFAGVAALYFLLEAPFIGVVQVLVYAGAVSILMLFAIMLTRQVTGEATRQLFERWWVAAVVALGIFTLVLAPTILQPSLPNLQAGTPEAAGERAGWPRVDRAGQPGPDGNPVAVGNGTGIAGALEIGRSFMSEYLLPFEVASVLLLVALIGAVVIAYEERSRRRRVLTLAEETALRRSTSEAQSPPPLAASAGEAGGQSGRTARTY
ncbi:MAG: NADH-quinone oxidoreductase subunit, partial [Alphaproteobacteria bacterium]|nr:NADH-quinone oxidoreductase subunit [Alphaproteobacteria bacterium]